MSPFDGQSCLLFWAAVRGGRVPAAEREQLLLRHSLVCDCDCPVCDELRILQSKEAES
jgi:hypothetical protein